MPILEGGGSRHHSSSLAACMPSLCYHNIWFPWQQWQYWTEKKWQDSGAHNVIHCSTDERCTQACAHTHKIGFLSCRNITLKLWNNWNITSKKSFCFVLNASIDNCLFFNLPREFTFTPGCWLVPLPFHFISENYAKCQWNSVHWHAHNAQPWKKKLVL